STPTRRSRTTTTRQSAGSPRCSYGTASRTRPRRPVPPPHPSRPAPRVTAGRSRSSPSTKRRLRSRRALGRTLAPLPTSAAGREAHASGDPENGINALDAFVMAYNGISVFRQQLREGARLHGFLKEGGTAPNIIPERTSGEFLVRARDTAYMEELVQKVKNIFQAAALATGCSVKLSFEEEPYTDLRNNMVLAGLFEENLRRVGVHSVEGAPWENAGSTDMGNVS